MVWIILSKIINSPTDTNAIIENWFRIVKQSILKSETGIEAGDFIRTMYTLIDDRLAAFKFAFQPLDHRVLNSKEASRCNYEEECKEEWAKRKREKKG